MILVAFGAVARTAQQLQVVHVIGPALALRGDVIHCEIAELERNLASCTMPFLLSEKQVFVCPVAGQFAKVRPSWNVGSVNWLEVVKQVDFLTDADLHKIGRFLG